MKVQPNESGEIRPLSLSPNNACNSEEVLLKRVKSTEKTCLKHPFSKRYHHNRHTSEHERANLNSTGSFL